MITGKIDIDSHKDEVKKELQARIETALETIGLMAESQAKLLCPVDTGRLRNSIAHAVQSPTVYIGTNVEYGPYIELGTSRNNGGQPFLVPAVTGQLDEYRRVVEEELKR